MKFIDTHAHLYMCEDKEKAIKQAKEKDVLILNAGVDKNSNRKVLKTSEKYKNVKACLGLYPIDLLKMSKEEIKSELKFIEKNKDKIIGLGEIGLDLYWTKNEDDLKKQKKVLEKFIDLSKKISKPLIVHSRKAEKETIDLLEEKKCKKIVMHCFSGRKKYLKRIIENGWMLTIPSNVKYNKQFQENVKELPIENLLCETDSPFLHPEKEKDNTPVNVIESYKKISEIKNLSLEKVKEKIFENFERIFK
jgi:TatD DNase family protein